MFNLQVQSSGSWNEVLARRTLRRSAHKPGIECVAQFRSYVVLFLLIGGKSTSMGNEL